MMNFGKAFTYIFEDERWFDKLLTPLLVSLIPVIGTFALTGYTLRTLKNVAQNELRPLPEFDFGQDLGRGFRYFLVELVYALPILLLLGIMVIPMFMIENSDSAMGLGGVLIMVISIAVMVAYSLFLAIIQPIAMANFAVKDSFASAFEWGNFFKRLGNNFGAWLLVFAGVILTGFIAPLGMVIFVIGVVITSAYSQLMVAHLAGQAYAASEVKR
ncbi:MAG: DUF4013 domain-containing protein [Anaerolineaceae bacterium]|nr:DUF4013 domain-containing protein [Anaerolineaceae bacterium]